MKRLTVATAVCAIAVAGVTAAWAVGEGGTIKACFSKSQGTWRPIDTAGSCRAGETVLEFYSKAGAQAAFLAINGKAADSDLLDGIDSTGFLGATAKAADSDLLDGIDSTGFLGATAKAADSDKLDGIDSTGFLGSTAKAADSEKLDGIDSSGLVQGGGSRTSFQFNTGNTAFRDTAAGAIFVGCNGNGTFLLTYDPGAPAAVWLDDGGTVTRLTASGPAVVLYSLATGNRHVVLRATNGGWTGQWDLMVNADGVTCNVSVLEDISPLTAVS